MDGMVQCGGDALRSGSKCSVKAQCCVVCTGQVQCAPWGCDEFPKMKIVREIMKKVIVIVP